MSMCSSIDKPYPDMVLMDFYERFPDEATCWKHFLFLKWSEGFICPACKKTHGCFYKPSRKVFECYNCKHQASLTSGTIFHKTRILITKWFWFIFFIATSKKGISMLYLQEQLRISYNTAWSMGHKIRKAMAVRNALYDLHGIAEADEIFIGEKQTLDDRRKSGDN